MLNIMGIIDAHGYIYIKKKTYARKKNNDVYPIRFYKR